MVFEALAFLLIANEWLMVKFATFIEAQTRCFMRRDANSFPLLKWLKYRTWVFFELFFRGIFFKERLDILNFIRSRFLLMENIIESQLTFWLKNIKEVHINMVIFILTRKYVWSNKLIDYSISLKKYVFKCFWLKIIRIWRIQINRWLQEEQFQIRLLDYWWTKQFDRFIVLVKVEVQC